MRQICKAGIPIWQFEEWEQYSELVHGFSTRFGDAQKKETYFNLGLHIGDDATLVCKRRKDFVQALGILPEQIVAMEQVHGVAVQKVTQADRGKGAFDMESAFRATDGLVTDQAGVALFACFADCVPLYFYDPIKKVIGLSHGGWKGTVGGIAQKTVLAMAETYGSQAKDILCAIGPSIGPCHYQIGNAVIAALQSYTWCDDVLKQKADGMYLDLWQTNAILLQECGLLKEHITFEGVCTYCSEDFFSYRRENGNTGRMAAVLMIK